jgi:hypothetical protein
MLLLVTVVEVKLPKKKMTRMVKITLKKHHGLLANGSTILYLDSWF